VSRVVLQTPRLVLRTWASADAESYLELYKEPEMFRWLGDGTGQPPTDLARVRQRLSQLESVETSIALWATCERVAGGVVGNCGLVKTEEAGGPELVYHIGRPYWGLGYATEAAQACLDYGLLTVGLTRIVALVYPENRASVRVLEKVGMRSVGVRRAYGTDLRLFERVAESGVAMQSNPGGDSAR
jgi:ribosomal-protein-alanine N-acetyltransferase